MKYITASKSSYFWDNLFWGGILFFLFMKILFRPLSGWNYSYSKRFLMLWLLGWMGVCILVQWRKHRFSIYPFFNAAVPLGIYAVLAYAAITPLSVWLPLCAGVLLSARCVWNVLRCRRFARIEDPVQRRKVRVTHIARDVYTYMGMGLTVVLLVMGLRTCLHIPLFAPEKVEMTVSASDQENRHTIEGHLDQLQKLQDGSWDKLSAQEKINVLQAVLLIEKESLGLPDAVSMGVYNQSEHTLGAFSDQDTEILISYDHILQENSWEMVETVCHEAYHCYQHRLIALYEKSDPEFRKLEVFRHVPDYIEEFGHYISGDEDYEGYYNQYCERDAREYASSAAVYYELKISYLLGDDSDVDDDGAPEEHPDPAGGDARFGGFGMVVYA